MGGQRAGQLQPLAVEQAASAGTISFKGQDVSSLDAATRCRMGIVRTHQVPQPFSGMTVFENVFTAATHGGGFRRAEAYERCIDAIELCGMTAVANRRAATLGLLDRKRLELTRALATHPQVLLLDEIGGGLTDGEAAELVQTIKVLHARDIAIVWIEHIVHVLLQVAKRLVCMDSGRVIAEGDPQAVLSNATVVDAYLGGGR